MTSCCFFVSLSSLCFATDEDGRAVENFCNTLFKCIILKIYTYYTQDIYLLYTRYILIIHKIYTYYTQDIYLLYTRLSIISIYLEYNKYISCV
jgi:hypothetical protein